jgi:hypothetical protein
VQGVAVGQYFKQQTEVLRLVAVAAGSQSPK